MLANLAVMIALPFVIIVESLQLLAAIVWKVAIVALQFYMICVGIVLVVFILAITFLN